jgi:putative ABC transport system permease protein
LQWVRVSGQVGMAVCELCGAGLLLRSFQALSQVSAGFDASNVLVLRLTGTYAESSDIPKLRQSVKSTLEALRAMPGINSAAVTLFLPGVPFKFPVELTSPETTLDPTRKITAESRYVSEGYFAALRIPVLAGQVCDKYSDGVGLVVNRSFVNTYFGANANPIGRHFITNQRVPGDKPSSILGIVADAREAGLDQFPGPTVYWCGAPLDPGRYYLLRTNADPASLASAIRQKLHSIEPARAVYDLAPLPTFLSDAFSEVRLRTILLTLFAATALALACIGLYGTMSYFVNTRRREVGLRMALGEEPRQIGRRFIAQGLRVTGVGVLAGLCLTGWSARFISALLYNVGAHDLVALSAAVATMLFVALLASTVPAVRAARLDPIQTLREE